MLKHKKLALTVAILSTLASGQAFSLIASPNVVITELNGQTVFEGDGGYDQIDYHGFARDYVFVRNPDHSVSVTTPDGHVDRLINIDGIWFADEAQWYAIGDLEQAVSSGQTITGSADGYDQVDYPGHSHDYQFVQNANASVSVTKPGGDVDTLIHIDGIWFKGEKVWYPIADLIVETEGDRTITGGSGYDQVDYPGDSLDYIFVQNANGTVTVSKPDGTTDILRDIDGFWFQGEEEWYPLDSVIAQHGQTVVGTSAYDQVDYDGFRSEYVFVQNASGTVTVTRPNGAVDTLTSIDGFWFRAEEAWYSIADIIDADVNDDSGDNSGDDNNDTDDTDDNNSDDNNSDDNNSDDDNADDSNAETGILIDGVITGSNDVNDTVTGDAGNNVFFVGRGVDLVRGLGGQDTLRVDGDVFEWTFAQNDGVTTMSHPTWGVNTLISVERIFSLRAGEEFTLNEAVASTAGLPALRLDNDNVINGTPGNDFIPAQAGVQGFYGGLGNDTYQGTGDFEQVNYDGARAEYTFTQNNNGSIRVSHPIWGTDTLVDIDALIFTGFEPGVGGAQTAPFEFVNVGDLVG